MSDALVALSIDSLGGKLIKILKLSLKIEEAEEIGGPTSDLQRCLDMHEERVEKDLKQIEKVISGYRKLGTEKALESADRAEKAIEEQFDFVRSQRDLVRSEIQKTIWHALEANARKYLNH